MYTADQSWKDTITVDLLGKEYQTASWLAITREIVAENKL